jgi:hypothetical protein
MLRIKCNSHPRKCGLCKKQTWEGFMLWNGFWGDKRVVWDDDIQELFGEIKYQRKRSTADFKTPEYIHVVNRHCCIKVTKPLNQDRRILLAKWHRYLDQIFCDDCVLINEELKKLPKYGFENNKFFRLKYSPSSKDNWMLCKA